MFFIWNFYLLAQLNRIVIYFRLRKKQKYRWFVYEKMACKLSDEVTEVVNKELDEWLNCNDDGNLVLLEVSSIIGLHKFDTTLHWKAIQAYFLS